MSIERGLLDLVVDGAAVTGRFAAPSDPSDAPLVVAIHGAGHTGGYFDTDAASLLTTGARLGFTTVALDRPGYGGSTPPASGADGFEAVAGVLAAAIGQVQAGLAAEAPGVVVTGHSSGAAIAVLLASLADLPFTLLGLSIVGLGPELGDLGRELEATLPPDGYLDPPPIEVLRQLLFGPAWTYAEQAASALVPVSASVPVSEPRAVNRFPELLAQVATRISVPVQCVMPELDLVWPYSPENLRRLTEAFTAAPYVEGIALRAAGHAADHHLTGRGLHLRQLAFAMECAVAHRGAS